MKSLFYFYLFMLAFLCYCQSKPAQKQFIGQSSSQKKDTIAKKEAQKEKEIPDSLKWKKKETGTSWVYFYSEYKYYDINGDGWRDSLIKENHSSNDGFGSKRVLVKSGKDQQSMVWEIDFSPAYIKDIYAFPIDEYIRKGNIAFFEALKEAAVGVPSKVASPPFQWIIDATVSNQVLTSHPYFVQFFRFKPNFQKGKFQFPWGGCSLEVKNDSLEKVCNSVLQKRTYQSIGDLIDKKGKVYFLNFSGFGLWAFNEEIIMKGGKFPNDYKVLKQVGKSTTYTLYTLPHAVLVKKRGAYAWVFVSDYDLTGGPKKMRLNSIKSAKLIGKYVIIHHDLGPIAFNSSQVFIVNIESGKGVRLKSSTNTSYQNLFAEMEKFL